MPDGVVHSPREFLIVDGSGEAVAQPLGMSRRNDFIRSRRQDADGAGDFGSRQVGTEVVGQNELDGQVGEGVPGGRQQAVKGNQKYQLFYIPDGGDLGGYPGAEALAYQNDVVRGSSRFLQHVVQDGQGISHDGLFRGTAGTEAVAAIVDKKLGVGELIQIGQHHGDVHGVASVVNKKGLSFFLGPTYLTNHPTDHLQYSNNIVAKTDPTEQRTIVIIVDKIRVKTGLLFTKSKI